MGHTCQEISSWPQDKQLPIWPFGTCHLSCRALPTLGWDIARLKRMAGSLAARNCKSRSWFDIASRCTTQTFVAISSESAQEHSLAILKAAAGKVTNSPTRIEDTKKALTPTIQTLSYNEIIRNQFKTYVMLTCCHEMLPHAAKEQLVWHLAVAFRRPPTMSHPFRAVVGHHVIISNWCI